MDQGFRMLSRMMLSAAIAAGAIGTAAQDLRFRYPDPPAGAVTVQKDVPYGAADGTRLLMDVYRPNASGGPRFPVLIFFNAAVGPQKTTAFGGFYGSWAQTAASKGIVGIVPDLRQGHQVQDFQRLLSHLAGRSADYGIDREAMAVYAGSGNVFTAFPMLQDPAQTAIKAAVMYYGSATVTEFRRDLPVLYVRAGLDRPELNRAIVGLASRALSQNAPITLLNHPTGHHGFEAFDDDDGTREIIERTLDFVKRATAASYQVAIRRRLTEATAAGHLATGNHGQAVKLYAELVAAHPDDARLRLAYGEALLGDRQHAAACAELERLKGKGLGPRDLGLPAARACMQKGDAEAAIAWLRSIPQRFLPADVANDPVFAPLRDRPDFRALFEPR
jgi:Tetratricopeptide repeat